MGCGSSVSSEVKNEDWGSVMVGQQNGSVVKNSEQGVKIGVIADILPSAQEADPLLDQEVELDPIQQAQKEKLEQEKASLEKAVARLKRQKEDILAEMKIRNERELLDEVGVASTREPGHKDEEQDSQDSHSEWIELPEFKSLTHDIQQLQDEWMALVGFVERMTGILEEQKANDRHIKLKLGGPPYVFSGWDNKNASGYAWDISISDPLKLSYFCTRGARDMTNIYGGGRDIAYEFHPLATGHVYVLVSRTQVDAGDEKEQRPDFIRCIIADTPDFELRALLIKLGQDYAELQRKALHFGITSDGLDDFCCTLTPRHAEINESDALPVQIIRLRLRISSLQNLLAQARAAAVAQRKHDNEMLDLKVDSLPLKKKLAEVVARMEAAEKRYAHVTKQKYQRNVYQPVEVPELDLAVFGQRERDRMQEKLMIRTEMRNLELKAEFLTKEITQIQDAIAQYICTVSQTSARA